MQLALILASTLCRAKNACVERSGGVSIILQAKDDGA
jgi:hypothetical protein